MPILCTWRAKVLVQPDQHAFAAFVFVALQTLAPEEGHGLIHLAQPVAVVAANHLALGGADDDDLAVGVNLSQRVNTPLHGACGASHGHLLLAHGTGRQVVDVRHGVGVIRHSRADQVKAANRRIADHMRIGHTADRPHGGPVAAGAFQVADELNGRMLLAAGGDEIGLGFFQDSHSFGLRC